LLWTADFALVRTILPIGGPDYYFPGAVKAMERLAALDFDTFVPSHFGYGNSKTSSTTSAS
jgi:glyoxylase-like metal-dependent hydrolase (beta-lactamase superfamily II)